MATNDPSASLGGAHGHLIANMASNNSIISSPGFTDRLANAPAFLLEHWDILLLESRIVFTALACIYIGAHGALRRPPSATPRKPKKGPNGKKNHDEDNEVVEGLRPTDAILFPMLAGTVIVGLYYLIKWLEDPNIINKVLGAYFSVMSLASLGKLFADALHMATGFVFPSVWRAKDGSMCYIDSQKKAQWCVASGTKTRVLVPKKNTPFGGRWSESTAKSNRVDGMWELRRLFKKQWTVRFSILGLFNENMHLKLNDILGGMLAVCATTVYYTTKSVFLSNMMGYAFSYVGIIMMSPTTFTTGSAVLFGLFFYDIYMVFYTPYMVTVATKLDVPIKLVFQGSKKASMLGLGDIVIPGMFIGLCLRFDHYMQYHRQRQLVPVLLETETKASNGDESTVSKETQRMVVKPEYISPQGQWGNRWWSTKFTSILSPTATPKLKASAFPKTYFHASMVGYLIAIVVTLVVLLVFNHAQPALLYLVPGVVFSVWLTGLVRGEIGEMWIYTEDGSLDGSDTVVEVDRDGNVTKEIKKSDKTKEATEKEKDAGHAADDKEPSDKEPSDKEPSDKESKDSESPLPKKVVEQCVFNFQILAPPSSVEA